MVSKAVTNYCPTKNTVNVLLRSKRCGFQSWINCFFFSIHLAIYSKQDLSSIYYESGLPFLSPGELPDPGMEPTSLESPVLAGQFFNTQPPGKPCS